MSAQLIRESWEFQTNFHRTSSLRSILYLMMYLRSLTAALLSAMNDIDGTVPDIETALDSGKESLDALKTSLVAIKKTLDNGKERLNNIVDKIDSIDDEKSLAGFVRSLSFFAPSDFWRIVEFTRRRYRMSRLVR